MSRPQKIQINAPTISDADRRAVCDVLDTGWVGTGPECEAFERELAQFLGADHVVCVDSCTAALQLMLDHLALGPHSRVAVPAWTHVATALPAVHRGAQVVLVDCDPHTLAMDVSSLERAISNGIDVAVPVHFAGVPVPRAIWDLCDAHGVLVVEDAAHAFGASDELGLLRGLGSVGAAFSFHATKNLTCGEGGAIVTTDGELASALRHTRLHGLELDAWQREITGTWTMGDLRTPGRKANLPDILAALGRSQLSSFNTRQAHRRVLTDRYLKQLDQIDGISRVPVDRHIGSADHMIVAVLPPGVPRDRIVDFLAGHGISTGLHYAPLHHLSWFRTNATIAPGGLPVCDDLADRALTLPLHASLQLEEIDLVCEHLDAAIAAA